MQLVVTAKKLNKRRIVPANFPDRDNIIGEVKEGFSFEGEEVAIVPNPDLGKWYQDRDGSFYWGGGISEALRTGLLTPAVLTPARLLFDSSKMSWGHKFYDIPFIWNDLGTKGKGVTIAVIDTGIDENHADLISNIHPLSKSFRASNRSIETKLQTI